MPDPRVARNDQCTCCGPAAPAHREDVYFGTADFFGGAAFFRGAAFVVGGLSASLTALPAWNRTALLAAILMASPVCGFRPSRAGRAATSKEPRPATRTASPATRASRMAFTTAFTAWPTAAWLSSVVCGIWNSREKGVTIGRRSYYQRF